MQDAPKIVVKRMAEGQGLKPHPDADLLTAFGEQSLPPLEREQLVQHLEICSECRDVVALALPEAEVFPARTLPARSDWGWLGRPALRFRLATAAMLAIAFLGFLQYRQHELRNEFKVAKLDQRDSLQQANKEASAQTVIPAPSLSGGTTESKASSSDISSPDRVLPDRSGAKPELRARRRTLPALSLGENREVAAGSGGRIGSGSGAGKGLAVPQPAPSSVTTETSSEGVEVATQGQPQDELIQRKQASNNPLANADVVKAKAAAAAPAVANRMPAFAAPNVSSLHTSPSLMVHASPLWTVNSAGALQRSFDAGKTWEEVNPIASGLPVGETTKKAGSDGQEKNLKQAAAKLMFRAVAAIGPEVWAGGSDAMLYHSNDSGARWQQVLFPPDSWPTGDIVTIQFTDPHHGTVATSTSEVWTTANSGQSWQKQQ